MTPHAVAPVMPPQPGLLATLVKSGRKQGIGHAAEFFDLVPTELSTAVSRNDLTAAYLGA